MNMQQLRRRQAARQLEHSRIWAPDRFDVRYSDRDEEDHYFDDEQDEAHCLDCGLLHDECECRVGEECGRWRNGRLDKYCTKAGSEECDFECPYNR